MMRRRLFTSASVLSLLLCLATVVFGARSYWIYDVLDCRYHDQEFTGVSAISGNVNAYVDRYLSRAWEPFVRWRVDHAPATSAAGKQYYVDNIDCVVGKKHRWDRLGFGAHWGKEDGDWEAAVSVPVWFIAALMGILPICYIRDWKGRLGSGSCHTCGYNLTGNASGVCSECGAAIPGTAGL